MASIISRALQNQCRQTALHLCSRSSSNFTMTSAKSQTHEKDFWAKNAQLSRPMSPHLTIYKFPLPANLSILHRATGLAASVVLYGAGIGALAFSGTTFPEMTEMVQANVPHFMITLTKAGIGGSLIYHTLNGVRHLVWDVGYGFQLKHLYMSGYLVVALTAIGTAVIFIRG